MTTPDFLHSTFFLFINNYLLLVRQVAIGLNHFFHRDPTVLKSAVKLFLILMISIGIHEIVIILGKDKVIHNAFGGQSKVTMGFYKQSVAFIHGKDFFLLYNGLLWMFLYHRLLELHGSLL